MNLWFSFLSAAYISAIFLFADSPVVSGLSTFNPLSLLHIPLYGTLTILLIFAFVPFSFSHFIRILGRNVLSSSNDRNDLNDSDPINTLNTKSRFFIAGVVGLIVSIADEYHQSFIPTREASVTDVLLDLFGIGLGILLVSKFLKWSSPTP
ncbi:MAG TPA: VanZ family protein [Thermodesulfobacteriota bacterium]|nr:VanZ family protein [Thermodesulfobacteriota bacterium]